MRFVIIFVGSNPSIFVAPAVSAAKVKAYADWGGWRLPMTENTKAKISSFLLGCALGLVAAAPGLIIISLAAFA